MLLNWVAQSICSVKLEVVWFTRNRLRVPSSSGLFLPIPIVSGGQEGSACRLPTPTCGLCWCKLPPPEPTSLATSCSAGAIASLPLESYGLGIIPYSCAKYESICYSCASLSSFSWNMGNGFLSPRSQRPTVSSFAPMKSPNSFCVIPSFFLRALISSGVITQVFYHRCRLMSIPFF